MWLIDVNISVMNPSRWDGVHHAEVDAYYASLYGLTHDEVRYILDPKDFYGEDFPAETSRARGVG